jgi:hypothetical protein
MVCTVMYSSVCVCVGVRHATPLLCNVGLHAKGNKKTNLH